MHKGFLCVFFLHLLNFQNILYTEKNSLSCHIVTIFCGTWHLKCDMLSEYNYCFYTFCLWTSNYCFTPKMEKPCVCGLLGWTVDGFFAWIYYSLCISFQNLCLWMHMSSQMELIQTMLRFTFSSRRNWLTIAEVQSRFTPWSLEYVL